MFTGTNRCYPTNDPDVTCPAAMDGTSFKQNPQGEVDGANNVRTCM